MYSTYGCAYIYIYSCKWYFTIEVEGLFSANGLQSKLKLHLTKTLNWPSEEQIMFGRLSVLHKCHFKRNSIPKPNEGGSETLVTDFSGITKEFQMGVTFAHYNRNTAALVGCKQNSKRPWNGITYIT